MRSLGPARARTAAYMNISISSSDVSGKGGGWSPGFSRLTPNQLKTGLEPPS